MTALSLQPCHLSKSDCKGETTVRLSGFRGHQKRCSRDMLIVMYGEGGDDAAMLVAAVK